MAGLFDGYGGTGQRSSGGGATNRKLGSKAWGDYGSRVSRRSPSADAPINDPQAFLQDLTKTDLEAILSSPDTPESVKKLARQVVEGKSDGKPDGGVLHTLTHNPLTDTMGAILQVIDKPKR